jgi:Flp pilus assembly pilin Flp
MRELWVRLWEGDEAVTAIEYALIAGLIMLVIVVAVRLLSDKNKGMYDRIEQAMRSI